MKVLALLSVCLVFWSASAEPLPSECRWGASFWCRSKEAAKSCGRVEYCQTHVWRAAIKTTSSVSSSGLSCDACDVVATLVHGFLSNAKLESEAKMAAAEMCNDLPGEIGKVCSTIVKDFFDQIWKLAQTEMDASAICKQLGLCSSSLSATQHVSIDTCAICKVLIASYIKPFVDSNATEKEVKDDLEAVCKDLPSTLPAECDDLVKQYFDLVWSVVKGIIDTGDFCKAIRLCNSSTSILRARLNKLPTRPALPKVSSTTCDLCKEVLKVVEPYVDSNATESEVKTILEDVCSAIPSVTAECKAIVDQYFDLVWSLVKGEIDSGEFCKQIGFCNSTTSILRARLPTRPALSKVSSGIECEACKLVLKEIQDLLAKNTSEEEAKAAMEKICSDLPVLASECQAIVKEYFDEIYTFLVKDGLDPAQVCKELGICTAKSFAGKQLKAPDGLVCNGCMDIMGKLINKLLSDKLEGEVQSMVTDICDKLPSKVDTSECQSMIKALFPVVWQFVKEEVEKVDAKELEQEACSLIHLCSSKTVRSVQTPQGSVKCVLCKLVANEVKSLVDKNSTQAEIKAVLGKVCGLLPSKYQSECNSFVAKYEKEILEGGIDVVCDALCLVGTSRSAVSVAMPMKPDNIVTCDVCLEAFEAVKSFLSTKSSQGEVLSLLLKVCGLMPSTVQAECSDFVNSYGPEVIKIVDNSINAQTMCQEIKLCSASRVKWISLRAGRNQL